jgi:hypothetical protein
VGASRSSAAIDRHTPIKEEIYLALLSSPAEEWTVRTLTTASDTGTSSVRDTI